MTDPVENICAFRRFGYYVLVHNSFSGCNYEIEGFLSGLTSILKSCIRLQFIQINNGAVELEPSVMGAQPNPQTSTRKVKVPLNSRYC